MSPQNGSFMDHRLHRRREQTNTSQSTHDVNSYLERVPILRGVMCCQAPAILRGQDVKEAVPASLERVPLPGHDRRSWPRTCIWASVAPANTSVLEIA